MGPATSCGPGSRSAAPRTHQGTPASSVAEPGLGRGPQGHDVHRWKLCAGILSKWPGLRGFVDRPGLGTQHLAPLPCRDSLGSEPKAGWRAARGHGFSLLLPTRSVDLCRPGDTEEGLGITLRLTLPRTHSRNRSLKPSVFNCVWAGSGAAGSSPLTYFHSPCLPYLWLGAEWDGPSFLYPLRHAVRWLY